MVDQIRQWDSSTGINDVFDRLRIATRQALGLPERSTAFDMQRLEPSFFVAIANAMTTAEPTAPGGVHPGSLMQPDEDGFAEGWYVRRPALGVGNPFCRNGDHSAAQVDIRGRGSTPQWCTGVVCCCDQSSDRAIVQFSLPHGEQGEWRAATDAGCCGSRCAGEDGLGRPQPIKLSIGLDDLPDLRWAPRTECGGDAVAHLDIDMAAHCPLLESYDSGESSGCLVGSSEAWQQPSVPPPPVLAPPPDVEPKIAQLADVTVATTTRERVGAPAVDDSVAWAAERAMPWDRFARATARLEGNLANAIAVSGRV